MTSIGTSTSTQPLSCNQPHNSCKAEVISLNNAGLFQLRQGNFSEAVRNLSAALSRSKACMSETRTREISVGSVSLDLLILNSQKARRDSAADSSARSSLEKDYDGDTCMEGDVYSQHFEANREGRIYNTPIHLDWDILVSKSDEDEENDSSDLQVVLSAVIIFNLALAYHLRAAARTASSAPGSSDEASKCLRKSIQLYEYAIQIQREAACMGQSSTLFALSALNNLGDAHSRLGDEAISEAYLRNMLSLLMYLVESHLVSDEAKTYLSLFFDNTFHLVCNRQQNAAPAA